MKTSEDEARKKKADEVAEAISIGTLHGHMTFHVTLAIM